MMLLRLHHLTINADENGNLVIYTATASDVEKEAVNFPLVVPMQARLLLMEQVL